MSALTFGPVTSRRFGVSLGVDLSPHEKRCNFDCLYCELAPAKPVTSINDAPLPKAYIKAILQSLEKFPQTEFITLTANGEPTLYPYLEELVDEILALPKRPKLLILSNASTIIDPKIASILKKIDVVKLSLDSVDERTFKRIDRPHKGLHVNEIVAGIKSFAKEYHGTLILEILVVDGVNDSQLEFEKLNDVIAQINPDRVDIGTIARPPAYKVKGVRKERLMELAKLIQNIPVTIPWEANYEETYDFTKEELLELLKKRPQNIDDVKRSFSTQTQAFLEELVRVERVYIQEVAGVKFYRS